MPFVLVDIRHVYFRRTIDGSIKGSDEGGSYHNEHSPEACAGLCMADPSCKSFDAGRQFPLRLDDTAIVWQPNIDNCFLSYNTKAELPADRWIAPKCDGAPGQEAPLDPDCDNPNSNKVDYYERITPVFIEFEIPYDDVVKPEYNDWAQPLLPTNNAAQYNDEPDKYFKNTYFEKQRYTSESATPRKELEKEVEQRYPHVARRASLAGDVVSAVKEVLKANVDQVAVIVEKSKSGNIVAHVNSGSAANDVLLQVNLKQSKVTLKTVTADGSARQATGKLVEAKDMICPDGTSSATGFGQGDTCVPCRVDYYVSF